MTDLATPDLATGSLVIDADSHVMEPRDLWLNYLEPRYRDRAIRIEERNGADSLIMGEQVILSGSTLAGLGGGHLTPTQVFTGGLSYEDGCPPASNDPAARADLYDELGISAGVVFPTIGILPFPCDDNDLVNAYCRAYNRWQADFAADSRGRVLPIALLNMADIDAACDELSWCCDHGFRGMFLPPEPVGNIRPGLPHFDRLWAQCAEAGIPACVHVVVRFGGAGVPFEPWHRTGAGLVFGFILGAPGQVIPTITSMVLDGTFDRHPNLKVVCVEAGCGWAPYLMDRLDEKVGHFSSVIAPLALKPSDYLRRNVWYVAEPGERTIGAVLDLVGEDRVLWGSDFPHIDSSPDAVEQIRASLHDLHPDRRGAVLGKNAAALFGVD